MKQLSVYLAGPDVFYDDAEERGIAMVITCEAYGLRGHYPLDATIDISNLSKFDAGKAIYEANVELIKRSDVVLANLNNFRGYEPDSGTVWEVAFACALGKPVYAYMMDFRELIYQVPECGEFIDPRTHVEDFECQRNIMINHSVKEIFFGGVDFAIKQLANRLS